MALNDKRKIPIENTNLGIIYDNPLDHFVLKYIHETKNKWKKLDHGAQNPSKEKKRKEKKKFHSRNTIQ
jgi:hypothetical protein